MIFLCLVAGVRLQVHDHSIPSHNHNHNTKVDMVLASWANKVWVSLGSAEMEHVVLPTSKFSHDHDSAGIEFRGCWFYFPVLQQCSFLLAGRTRNLSPAALASDYRSALDDSKYPGCGRRMNGMSASGNIALCRWPGPISRGISHSAERRTISQV